MTIGEKLKKSRNDKGMSLRELATKVELSASFLSQIEQGKASPSIENLKKIAHTLDVRVAYLIEDEEDDIRNIEHIKKENIGLIEVMGLAILPGRLKNELLGLETAIDLINQKREQEKKRHIKAFEHSNNDFVTPIYLKKAGIVATLQGKKDDALKYYERIKDEFPTSEEARTVDILIGKISY